MEINKHSRDNYALPSDVELSFDPEGTARFAIEKNIESSKLTPRNFQPSQPLYADQWIWSLAGGGAKGSFQVGVLLYLAKHYGKYTPKAVVGTSVGAINSILIAQDGSEGIHELKNIWLNLQNTRDMYIESDQLKKILDEIRVVKRFDQLDDALKVKTFIEEEESSNEKTEDKKTPLRKKVRRFFRRMGLGAIGTVAAGAVAPVLAPGIGVFVGKISDQLKKAYSEMSSLYSLSPIKEKIFRRIQPQKMYNSPIELRMVSVALEDGALCYVDQHGDFVRVDANTGRIERFTDTPENRISNLKQLVADGAAASAAIPLSFEPVKIENSTLVDGGVRDVLPVHTTLQVLKENISTDAKKGVICIHASNKFISPWKNTGENVSILELADRIPALFLHEIGLQDKLPSALSGQEIKKIEIAPHFSVHSGKLIDPGLVRINIFYGHMLAYDEFYRFSPKKKYGDTEYKFMQLYAYAITKARRDVWGIENNFIELFGNNFAEWKKHHKKRIDDLRGKRKVSEKVASAILWNELYGEDRKVVWRSGALQKIRTLKKSIQGLIKGRIDFYGDEDCVLVDLEEPDNFYLKNFGLLNTARNKGRFEENWSHFEYHIWEKDPRKYGDYSPWTEHMDIDGNVIPAEGGFIHSPKAKITNGDAGRFAEWARESGVQVVTGDFSGNGRTDIALVRKGGDWGSIPIAFANGDGTFKITNGDAGRFAEWARESSVQVVTGDFSGNGRTDIALVRKGGDWGSIPIAFANGDGTFKITNGDAGRFAEWARERRRAGRYR